MFALEETEISKAIDRARELHPVVRVVRFGEYTVTGSKDSAYAVRCYRGEDGLKYCDCTCKTRDGVACNGSSCASSLYGCSQVCDEAAFIFALKRKGIGECWNTPYPFTPTLHKQQRKRCLTNILTRHTRYNLSA
jgi:hypothetical protein